MKGVLCVALFQLQGARLKQVSESWLTFSITEISSWGLLGTNQNPQRRVVTYTAPRPKTETSLQGLARAIGLPVAIICLVET